MNSKLNSLNTIFSHLTKTLKLVWSASGFWTLAWVVILIVQGLLPAISITLIRQVVDNLVAVSGAGISSATVGKVLTPVSLMAGVLLLTEFFSNAGEWIRTAQSELISDKITGLIHQQSVGVDYGFYEYSEYNDKLNRAREGAAGRSLGLLENMGNVVQNCVTLFAMAAVLLPYGLWLPTILIISALPFFYVLLYISKVQYKWSQKTTTDRRWLMYYDYLLTNDRTAAEVRLFDFANYFQNSYQKLRKRLRREQFNLLKLQTLGRVIATVFALTMTGTALAWMGRQVLLGILTLGDLALFFQSFNQGLNIVRDLMSNLGKIYRDSLFIGNLFEFLEIKAQITDPANPVPIPSVLQKEIRFRQVTFRYPGSHEPVMENFNLTLPAGKVVAIVGDNGAGKSTLIKLLCRFYDPDSGSIELDGIDIRQFSVKAFRRLITVLFQSHIPYYTTAAENIALGDISAPSSQAEIEAAAKASGIHEKITRLPLSYNSMLGKLFPDGHDLSGGQWQRLALARAFYRRAEIIILDEPTSAMDPWGEHDWLERFRTLARGRTSIVITHRFTLAMRADIIHVMRAGKIVESGSHDELLKLGGFYAESWQDQMQSTTIAR
ncbi:ABC transporter ATP-binding protein [Dulcicalothrix desertica]|uniref:ABC transporter ATP-binding protein n=1 Tax=Dulcicalothrix desertica TaxID=32056 RepID=UPI000F8D590A|nr:ABC transporter ATP-binding protein [Dulcicalothrix desertica]TWH55722.1 ATP-binding cassette subfamily B protein [Dulcicalothrix desertica PCC 7102]